MSSEEDSEMDLMQDQSLKGCKVKRTRQRVDAGEPRNSYASIANFSSRGGYLNHPYHPFNGLSLSPPNKFIGDNNSKSNSSDMIVIDDAVMQLCVNGSISAGQIAPPFLNGGANCISASNLKTENNNNNRHSPELEFNYKNSGSYLSSKGSSEVSATTGAHLLRDILQTGRKFGESVVDSDQPNFSGNNKVEEGGLSQCSDASELDEDENECEENRDDEGMDQIASNANQSSPIREQNKLLLVSSRSPSPSTTAQSNRPNINNSNSNSSSAIAEVKRARVENIVSNMLMGSNGPNISGIGNKISSNDTMPSSVNGCKKRKLYQPQQSKLNGPNDDEDDDVEYLADEEELADDYEDEIVSEIDLTAKKAKTEDRDNLRRQLEDMQSQLIAMRQRYVQLFEAQQQQQQQHQKQQLLQQQQQSSKVVQLNPLLVSSPVNLTTSASPADECDTEMDDLGSDKGIRTPVSQLSEMTNRDTPAAISANVTPNNNNNNNNNNISDPSHFLDEARRLISEQEKMANKSDRQTCIVRTHGSSLSSSSSAQASMPDIEWLIESLKGEIQSSVTQIIDTTFSRFLQRRATPQKLNIDQNEPKNDITILSQMLDRKSPRTKVIDRGAAIAVSSMGNAIKGNLNSHLSRGSPYSLPTETAPAPKPTPFSYPGPSFKSPFYIPSIAPPGAQIPHQPALIPSALAHHFNSIASTLSLNQVNQRNEQSNSYNNRESYSMNSNNNNMNGHTSNHSVYNRNDEPLPEQTEAMALVVAPKRKRHKVTDTRITPRTVSRLLGQEPLMSCNNTRDVNSVSPPSSSNYHIHGPPPQPPPPLVPVSLPTSVAIPNPSLHQSDLFSGGSFPFGDHPRLSLFGDDSDLNRDHKGHNAHAVASAVAHAAAAHHLQMLAATRASPDSMHGYSSVVPSLQYGRNGSDNGAENGSETNETQVYDPTMPMTSTLTPMHLRKAKLMFFFVRYPSSAILKMFFPDIKFNKNNTAQLVKWFSNFREFYYIQMEKYARQSLSEGVKNSEELRVGNDSELLRVLNLHYNRNNHIDVPENFRYVSEQTLREFFKAVQSGKDTEQSWKKAIYKIIARLDDNVPEYFKSPNFLEQLE